MPPSAGMDGLAVEFLRQRASRIADAHLADQLDAVGVDRLRAVLAGERGWREDPARTWTHDGPWHFSIIRMRQSGTWGCAGELATLGAVASRLGLAAPVAWPTPLDASPDQGERLEKAGWSEVDQLTRLSNPCYERREGRRRAVVAFTGFNKTFVPGWCGGGDLYLCLHAAIVLAS